MKINKVIFAVDDSHYLDFWPTQAKICKEILNIEPVLFHITNENNDFYNDGHGLVKKIKKVDGINTGAQAAMGRMFFTKYFPEEVCLVADIDLISINRNYLQVLNSFYHLSIEGIYLHAYNQPNAGLNLRFNFCLLLIVIHSLLEIFEKI